MLTGQYNNVCCTKSNCTISTNAPVWVPSQRNNSSRATCSIQDQRNSGLGSSAFSGLLLNLPGQVTRGERPIRWVNAISDYHAFMLKTMNAFHSNWRKLQKFPV